MKIYNLLVNRHSGIADRYHRLHDNSGAIMKCMSYLYLLFLNFCYYVLFCRFLGQREEERIYEEKRLITNKTESEMRIAEGLSVQETVDLLAGYDIVSFDIFDTLIFRPFDEPTALFFLLGERLRFMDFRRIRAEAEQDARQEKYGRTGSYEVSLEGIWNILEEKGFAGAEKLFLPSMSTVTFTAGCLWWDIAILFTSIAGFTGQTRFCSCPGMGTY